MPPSTSVPHDIVNATRKFAIATLTFAAFVVYGSLVPLDFHYRPFAEAWGVFRQTPYLQLGIGSRADWVANILLYLPLGFFGMGWLTAIDRSHVAAKGAFVLIVCMLMAVGIEFTQLFFPPRTVSLNDIIAELTGSVLGIATWLYAGDRLSELWDKVQRGGREGTHALIALYVIAYLALSLFPFDFLVSAAEIAEKLGNPDRMALFVTASCGGVFSCSGKLLSEVLIAAPLGVFLGIVAGGAGLYSLRRAFGWGILLGAVIEGLQTFLASGTGQGASIITRGVGMALGLVVYQIFRREWLFRFRSEIKIAVLFVLPLYLVLLLAINGFFTSALETHWAASAKLQETHFLPFYYHYYTTETHALYSLLINFGVYAPIGFVIWIYSDNQGGRKRLWLAALVAATAAFGIETMKLFLVDRKPDPTNILIAGTAAALTYFAATRLTQWTGVDPISVETSAVGKSGTACATRQAGDPHGPWVDRRLSCRSGRARRVGDRIAAQRAFCGRVQTSAAARTGGTAGGEPARLQIRPSAIAEPHRCRTGNPARAKPRFSARFAVPGQRRQGQPPGRRHASVGRARKRRPGSAVSSAYGPQV